MRAINFEKAKGLYIYRYTMEHVPRWASEPHFDETTKEFIGYYLPQYATDLEWYENTTFPGEKHISNRETYCESANQTWPMGKGFSKDKLKVNIFAKIES